MHYCNIPVNLLIVAALLCSILVCSISMAKCFVAQLCASNTVMYKKGWITNNAKAATAPQPQKVPIIYWYETAPLKCSALLCNLVCDNALI